MPLYTFLHNLPNVLVQIANKMGLQKKNSGFVLKKFPRRIQPTTGSGEVEQFV
jgi:hypothetical protein